MDARGAAKPRIRSKPSSFTTRRSTLTAGNCTVTCRVNEQEPDVHQAFVRKRKSSTRVRNRSAQSQKRFRFVRPPLQEYFKLKYSAAVDTALTVVTRGITAGPHCRLALVADGIRD